MRDADRVSESFTAPEKMGKGLELKDREERSVQDRLRVFVREQLEEAQKPVERDEEEWGVGEFGATDAILDRVYREHGVVYDDRDPRITKEQQEYTAEYFSALLEEFEERSLLVRTQEDHEKLVNLASQFYQTFLSVSPNISERLSTINKLLVTARARRIPELYNTIASGLLDELRVQMGFEQNLDRLIFRALDGAGVVKQLDVLLLIPDILMSVSVSEGEWDENWFDTCLSVINSVNWDPTKHPIVRHVAGMLRDHVELTYFSEEGMPRNPGVFDWRPVVRENDKWWRREVDMKETPAFLSHGSVARISRDVLGVLDDVGRVMAADRRDLKPLKMSDQDETRYTILDNLERVKSGEEDAGLGILVLMLDSGDQKLISLARNWLFDHGITEEKWEAFYAVMHEHQDLARQVDDEVRLRREKWKQASSALLQETALDIAQDFRRARQRDRRLPMEIIEDLEGLDKAVELLEILRYVKLWCEDILEHEPSLRGLSESVLAKIEVMNEKYRALDESLPKEKQGGVQEVEIQKRQRWEQMQPVMEMINRSQRDLVAYLGPELAAMPERDRPQLRPEPLLAVVNRTRHTRQFSDAKEQTVLWATMLNPGVSEQFWKDYGVGLEDLTLREQLFFLDFLARIHTGQARELRQTTKKYGIDVARAFLSAEFGDEFQEYVLQIAEILPESVARDVFSAYAKITENAQTEASELLREFFQEGKGKPVDSAKIEMELLTRAKRLIEDFAREAMKAKATGGEVNSEELLQKLEQANADTVLFASIFKAAFKGEKGVEFGELRGVQFETLHPEQLTEEDRKQMLAITDANWSEVPSMASFIHQVTKDKLETPSEQVEWQVLRKDGAIVAFCRFDKNSENPQELYGGSFNVDPEYRGSALGDALFQNTLDVRAKDHVIRMNVYPDSSVASAYVDKYHFVITGVEDVLLPGGGREMGFKIERDDTRTYAPTKASVTYDLATERDRMLKDIRDAEARGEVVTGFSLDKQNPNRRKLTYARVQSEALQEAS